jgi:endonuclease YncB( thermonuclease family)
MFVVMRRILAITLFLGVAAVGVYLAMRDDLRTTYWQWLEEQYASWSGEDEKKLTHVVQGQVTRILDGQTFEVTTLRQRVVAGFAGVEPVRADAPPPKTKPKEAGETGSLSKFLLEDLLKQTVTFQVISVPNGQRAMGLVWVGTNLFNATLIEKGFAQLRSSEVELLPVKAQHALENAEALRLRQMEDAPTSSPKPGVAETSR